jgi:hypothetical protein
MIHRMTPLPAHEKLIVAGKVYLCFVSTYLKVRRQPLPQLMEQLATTVPIDTEPLDPRRLGRIIQRVLRLGPWQARCLWTALVLYRLLRAQGDEPQLVIGLPREPRDKDAHAWVELEGIDVGPPPGRSGHEELTRFG